MSSAFTHDADVAGVARLLSDRARATMLFALSDGRALTAGALARVARVSPATASVHLAKLVTAGLLGAEQAGRHRYYRLAEPSIVSVMEMLAALATPHRSHQRSEPHAGTGVRRARTCYDHLAGALGVQLTEQLQTIRWLAPRDASYEVTSAGVDGFGTLGIDVAGVRHRSDVARRAFARACLDWSERRYHLAGALGAALCDRLFALEWIERLPVTRAIRVTNAGRRALRRRFEVTIY